MARLTGSNIEQFRGSSDNQKIDYFSLKEDREVGKIRLLYNGAEDIDGYVVHRVKVGDYELPVNCLFEQGGSVDDCPFCSKGISKQARVYIPVFDESDKKIKFWDRPNSFYGKLSGLCARYPNIVSQVFEVERHGARGKKSDYDFYPIGQPDGTTIDDLLDDCGLDDMPSALGTKIMNKSFDEMETYLQTGSFPTNSENPPSRRNREERREERREEPPVDTGIQRRTTRGRGRDAY